MMKKKRVFAILCMTLILGSVITAHAASCHTLALQVHETKVETDPIGLSKKATADVWNSAKSTGNVTVKIFAAWSGWPYTCEQTNSLAKGANATFVEKQSKDSSFKMRFTSNGGVAAVGEIYY